MIITATNLLEKRGMLVGNDTFTNVTMQQVSMNFILLLYEEGVAE